MINILYLIDSMEDGGTERQLVELILGLDRKKFTPHICTLHDSVGSHYERLDVPKSCLFFKSFCRPSLVKNVHELTTYIRKNNIDIVQSFFQDSTLLAALTKPFHKAKLIGSFRDLGFWRKTSENLKMRLAYPMQSGFIANSNAVKDFVVEVDRIPADKIQVIYNGFDVHQLGGLVCTPADPPIVGIVANLNRPVKRVQDFVAAAALVHRQLPEVCFCVVGGGYLQPELEKLAKSSELSSVIEFTGRLDNPLSKVSKWSVGVITSETEGLCNAIIEYMVCGLPVVVTDVGGNPEIVSDGENGFLVPFAAPDKLALQIIQLMTDCNLRKRISVKNSRETARLYSVSSTVEAHSDYYHQLLCLE